MTVNLGKDTPFIIFQDGNDEIQFSSINDYGVDDLNAFIRLLIFRRTTQSDDFIYKTKTYMYINTSSTYIKDQQSITIEIDVITRISQSMEVAYLFIRRIGLDERPSFEITKDYLFKEIFDNVNLSMTNKSLQEILSFISNRLS